LLLIAGLFSAALLRHNNLRSEKKKWKTKIVHALAPGGADAPPPPRESARAPPFLPKTKRDVSPLFSQVLISSYRGAKQQQRDSKNRQKKTEKNKEKKEKQLFTNLPAIHNRQPQSPNPSFTKPNKTTKRPAAWVKDKVCTPMPGIKKKGRKEKVKKKILSLFFPVSPLSAFFSHVSFFFFFTRHR